MKKGFTYIELLLVLFLIIVIGVIVFGVIRVQTYFSRSRDIQRLNDLQVLFSAIQLYINSTSSPDLDGPNYFWRGVDEPWATIFISVPIEREGAGTSTCFYNKPFVIVQADFNNYKNINGKGWLPINFSEILSLPFSSLPVDPLNNYQKGFYYAYAFQRNPIQFELSAKLESPEFGFGGISDKTSTDNGNDPYRYEIGSKLDIIPPLAP